MRKSMIAAAALAVLCAIGVAAPASAAPGMIGMGDAQTNIVEVGMHGHRHHRMRHHHHRRHMMRHHHHRRHMMRHHHHRGHMMRHGHRHHRM